MLGTLDATEDGRLALRFEREYSHPQATVWQAITGADRLSQWFDQLIDYGSSRLDFTEGADLLFVAKDDYLFPAVNGRVIQVDIPHLLEYTRASQTLRWQLEANGAGGCRLTLTVFTELRTIAIANAPHLHADLDMLRATLNGREPVASDLNELRREYERALG
ncbi:SRPBCC domain-containing protein [Actinomadura sp. HBU206391]|uniref:SRPBCC domain-containing protein n=1 Tax=Actinomadura sp. HBU206391 TaxID=2731692 RepID=UPI00164FE755|nr:SRPBCC domain-containing protein [Actinomadura sp. HBU206391]MBC6461584.1 SRPBCC domain-containing protein [Actinomadura sp. HBU206391]